jgi:hypothetical protein
MTPSDPSNDRLAPASRLAAMIEAYGAKSSRWPPAERESALIGINADLAAQDLVRAAAEFDRALDRFEVSEEHAALADRILGDFDAAVQRKRSSLQARLIAAGLRVREIVWPDAPLWKPAAALTLSILLGVFAGVVMHQAATMHDINDSNAMISDDGAPAIDGDQDNQ